MTTSKESKSQGSYHTRYYHILFAKSFSINVITMRVAGLLMGLGFYGSAININL